MMATSRELHDLRAGNYDDPVGGDEAMNESLGERERAREPRLIVDGVCDCGAITDPGFAHCPRCIDQMRREDDPQRW